MNEMRKLMEAVALNEFYVKKDMTFKDAFVALVGFESDWISEVDRLRDAGWNHAADGMRTVVQMMKETKEQLKDVWDEPIPNRAVKALDRQGNYTWEIVSDPETEKEYREYIVEGMLDAMDMLTNAAESLYNETISEENETF